MKNIILLASLVLLSGCSVVDSYMLSKYDNQEYHMITEIRYVAHQSQLDCADTKKSQDNAMYLARQVGVYAMYETEISNNTDSQHAANTLNDIAQALVKRYNGTEAVSETYCKLKFGGIENSAKLMQITQGNKPR